VLRGYVRCVTILGVFELAVVIPTLNEAGNVQPLVDRLTAVLAGVEWEVVFVDDDSLDGTADMVRRISQDNPRVRVLQRIGRSGLASACIEGMLSTAAQYLAVMDADLQHDESVLPRMLQRLKESPDLDIMVASRNTEGGSMGQFARHRQLLSQLGAAVSKAICRCEISDPMSGFFMLRRDLLHKVVRRLSGTGFKILVDILASSPTPLRVGEVPYEFRQRLHGASKLDINIGIEYILLVGEKLLGDVLPIRFVLFVLVGAVGAVLNLAELYVLYRSLHLTFITAQTIATVVAMVLNFFLNNVFTYRDLRLRGRRLWAGLLTFCAACSIGATISVALADFCLGRGLPWYLAAVIGLAIGSVWNFSITSVITWRRLRRRAEGRGVAELVRPATPSEDIP
jgi:dolichol-phosphate mannosyltransferase